jgi:hypothetical protein
MRAPPWPNTVLIPHRVRPSNTADSLLPICLVHLKNDPQHSDYFCIVFMLYLVSMNRGTPLLNGLKSALQTDPNFYTHSLNLT